MFSFGAVPYSAFSSNQETIQQISNGYRLSLPQNCPDEVYAVMLDCWRVEPKERPSFKNLFETLDDLLKKSSKVSDYGATSPQQRIEDTPSVNYYNST